MRNVELRAWPRVLQSITDSAPLGGCWERMIAAEGEVAEIVANALVGTVLFVDLQDAAVLGIGRRKNARRFARQEEAGIGTVAINKSADNEHATA